ncbi:MAG: inositol monophosphatase family protein [Candidatus Symbiobacter sp.]|nr:inositol monophosphatase family protein [Candidatus Symbiobacter sp.]
MLSAPAPAILPAITEDASRLRQDVAQLIENAATQVILPRFRALTTSDVREKNPGDLVTIADEEAEILLGQGLTAILPGADILGEEGVARDAKRLELTRATSPVWIIDPIDGTSNFVAGRENFAVIIGLAMGGVMVAGWIYQPIAGRMIYAQQGAGCFQLSGAGWRDVARLHFSGHADLASIAVEASIGTAYGRRPRPPHLPDHLAFEPSMSEYLRQSGRVGQLANQNSSGTEYVSLALGELHWSLHSKSWPWDHAAGMLMVTEAGGIAGTLAGGLYDWRALDQNPLAAVNAAVYEGVRAVGMTND